MQVCWNDSGGQVKCEPPHGLRVAFPSLAELIAGARRFTAARGFKSPQAQLSLELLWLVAESGHDLSAEQAERIVTTVSALLKAPHDVQALRYVHDDLPPRGR